MNQNSKSLVRFALAYCMPEGILSSFGQISLPILAKAQAPVGQIKSKPII